MVESATQRKLVTSERITLCAQVLADEHGLDGFTMDELATSADVSRRTLFNHFPGKVDAVLGPRAHLDEDAVAVFCDGGPDHDLLRDLRTLVLPLFQTKVLDREILHRRRRILLANPRLIIAVHGFYEELSAEVVGHIAVREGPALPAHRATVAVKLLAALFDAALDSFLADSRARSITFHFDESLRTARSLLGT
jgi:AcrR family transcriptional regulator